MSMDGTPPQDTVLRESSAVYTQDHCAAFCNPSSSDSIPDDSDEERESSGGSISDSSSDNSVISSAESSDQSSLITCIPSTEHLPQNVEEKTQPKRKGNTSTTNELVTMVDRKRKERHESSSFPEQDSKVIRAIESVDSTVSERHDGSTKEEDLIVENSKIEHKCVSLATVASDVNDKSDAGKSIPPISLTDCDYGSRTVPMDSPEIQRQWERTASLWQSRKGRRNYHRLRHYGRSSKSFSDAEGPIRSNHFKLEDLSINSESVSSSASVSPLGQEAVKDNYDDFEKMQTSTEAENKDLIQKTMLTAANLAPLHQLDLSTLHHQVESEEPISSSRRSSSELAMLSPRNSVTVVEGIESIPPTPPIHQLQLNPPISRQILEGNQESKINILSRQITNWKLQLKTLEEEHFKLMGYKPSRADRANHKEMRKCVIHINRAKHDLKQIREDPSSIPGITGTGNSKNPNWRSNLEEIVAEVETILSDDRAAHNRPEDPVLMNSSELMTEKGVMHKQLSILERRYGRPTTKEEKGIVRKLYDRYRTVKKMSVRVTSVKENSLDLVPILEHETLELQIDDGEMSPGTPGAEIEMKKSPSSQRRRLGRSALTLGSDSVEEPQPSIQNEDYNDMDLDDLERRYKVTSDEKRKLRSSLRTFTPESQGSPSGRLQKDEKYSTPESELLYQKYKHTRATLRLLQVLINKRKYMKEAEAKED